MDVQLITDLPTIQSFRDTDKLLVARFENGREQTYTSRSITYSDLSGSLKEDLVKAEINVTMGDSLDELKDAIDKAPTGRLFYNLANQVEQVEGRLDTTRSNVLLTSSSTAQNVNSDVVFTKKVRANTPTEGNEVATKDYVDANNTLVYRTSFAKITLNNEKFILEDLLPYNLLLDDKGQLVEKNLIDCKVYVTFRLTSNVSKRNVKADGNASVTTRFEGDADTVTKTKPVTKYLYQFNMVKPSEANIILSNGSTDVQVHITIVVEGFHC